MPAASKKTIYKDLAERFFHQHIQAHGTRPSHAKLMQHVAFRRGAKSWDELLADIEKKGCLQERLPWLFSPPLLSSVIGWDELLYSSPHKGLRLGLRPCQTVAIDLSDSALSRHVLAVGPLDSGVRSFFAHLAAQQVARGGGLLVIDSLPDSWFPLEISKTIEKVGRSDFLGATPANVSGGDCLKSPAEFWHEGLPNKNSSATAGASLQVELDIPALIAAGGCAYVGVEGGGADGDVAQLWAEKLTAALTARISGTAPTSAVPFLVMLPACTSFLQHLGPAFLAQARALGVAFALHASSLVELSNTGALEMALCNTATKAFFKPLSPASLTMSAEVLDSTVTPKKGARLSIQDWKDSLSRLGLAESLLVTYAEAQPLRTCLLSLKDPMPNGKTPGAARKR